MTLQELLLEQFKVKTRININPLVADGLMTGAILKILSNNPNRLAVLIINLGANPAYISFSNDPSATKGIIVSANGGSATLLWNEDWELTGYEIWALGTAGQNLYIVEVVTAE